ncbi:FxsA family protein [Lutibaculum baratangense]|uniref:FxsA protein n=1 Tax=Lutibaculum baratangense AMV1 TaxID=631454 RepID=V4RSD8_9HYPH|nr:FxsA family protein [Lutibaculum baratangense]ESR26050.1 FxsA protein [Lutibaculum baratangense AMV1]
MRLIPFLLFLVIPVIEISLFILVGQHIGVWPTIGIILMTALIGATLVRHQGLATLARLRSEVERNEMPARTLAEGAAILVAGLLLVTPGFLTDTIGFSLLVPPVRRGLLDRIGKGIMRFVRVVDVGGTAAGPRRQPPGQGPVIEGEFVEVSEEETRERDPNSPWRG